MGSNTHSPRPDRAIEILIIIFIGCLSLSLNNCASPRTVWLYPTEDFSINRQVKIGDKVDIKLKSNVTISGIMLSVKQYEITIQKDHIDNSQTSVQLVRLVNIKAIRKHPIKKMSLLARAGIGTIFLILFLTMLAWSQLGPNISI